MRSLVCIYIFLRELIHLVTVHQIPASLDFSILVFICVVCSILIVIQKAMHTCIMSILSF